MATIIEKSKKATKPLRKKAAHSSAKSIDSSDLERRCEARLHQDFAECWRKGIAFHYHNEMTRALGTKYSIRANPDGSEDLVKMVYLTEPLKSFDDLHYLLEKHLCGKGEGKYYQILKNIV